MTEYAPHQLTVVLANEQQRQRAHRNTFQKWGNALKLSEEQWEILRSELDAGSWAEGNSVVTWWAAGTSDGGVAWLTLEAVGYWCLETTRTAQSTS